MPNGTPTLTAVRETRQSATITSEAPRGGRFLIQLITPGWGSGGYYAAEVLEAAAGPDVFPAGTHMYLDHPGRFEDSDRPERTVRDLAAVLTSDARWDGGALIAEADVFPEYRDLLAARSDVIGVSIRAWAETRQGEAEGRHGDLITRIVEGISVDFVTVAGRGGEIRQVLESASGRPVRRAIERGVAEATANDTRDALDRALRDAYGGEQVWLWVRDFDDTTVWYERETPDDRATWQHAYTTSGAEVALAGDPIEVRATTIYVPVDPAGQSTTEESEEDPMPEIAEADLAALREASGRVSVLETERDTARQEAEQARAERDAARAELAERTNREAAVTRARARLAEAHADLAPVVIDRIIAEATRTVPVTEGGALDEAAVDAAVDAARTAEESYLASLRPAGIVGFGSVPSGSTSGTGSFDDLDRLGESISPARFGTVKG